MQFKYIEDEVLVEEVEPEPEPTTYTMWYAEFHMASGKSLSLQWDSRQGKTREGVNNYLDSVKENPTAWSGTDDGSISFYNGHVTHIELRQREKVE